MGTAPLSLGLEEEGGAALLPAVFTGAKWQMSPGCPLHSEGTSVGTKWELGSQVGLIALGHRARALPEPAWTCAVGQGCAGGGTHPSLPPNAPSSLQWASLGSPSAAAVCATVKGAAPHMGLGSLPAVPLLLGDLQSWSQGLCWPTVRWATAHGMGQWGWGGTCLPCPTAPGLFAVLEGAVPHGCWGSAPAVM